jgi:hypothetical protein
MKINPRETVKTRNQSAVLTRLLLSIARIADAVVRRRSTASIVEASIAPSAS